jgi:hypothetical protein
MNLPFVVDVAIGLIFIYLTLSLLTSEIQEIIGTVLQWRADHLKKSIQNLLADESLADKLYQTPLIKTLNQEGRGKLAEFFRKIIQNLLGIYQSISGSKSVFGDAQSGPSYIPSDTFSVALLRQVNVKEISQKVSELTIKKFIADKLDRIHLILDALRNSVGDYSLLEDEFINLRQNLEEIADNFIDGRSSLSKSIERTVEQLQQFLDNTESVLADNNHCKDILRRRLPYLRQSILRQELEPTISEVLRLIFHLAEQENLLADGSELNRALLIPRLAKLVDGIKQEHPDLIQHITHLPPQLKENLITLAEQAQTKADSLEQSVLQLEKEVASWFDNSMERASGVYKRNAKGIAIIIGFLVAISVNADTLYIVSRLSKDTTLRTTIAQVADQISTHDPESNVTTVNLEAVKTEVDQVLNQLPLPIGWDAINVKQQTLESQSWGIPLLRKLVGWAITGIALSMGASFWYDTLSKVMRVRNSGKPEGSK